MEDYKKGSLAFEEVLPIKKFPIANYIILAKSGGGRKVYPTLFPQSYIISQIDGVSEMA
ncbi:MAG: hypothetical protein FWC89_10705 [Defluviitaleaceae bacterium]|nr:hypothetical protein [Defluviitaleaceae bacterium]